VRRPLHDKRNSQCEKQSEPVAGKQLSLVPVRAGGRTG
jgi:hypothetical protein